jgi:hypothetical protein
MGATKNKDCARQIESVGTNQPAMHLHVIQAALAAKPTTLAFRRGWFSFEYVETVGLEDMQSCEMDMRMKKAWQKNALYDKMKTS